MKICFSVWRIFLFFLLGGEILISCSSSGVSRKGRNEFQRIDSVFLAQNQLVYYRPDSATRWVKQQALESSDSISYYYWMTHLSRCYFYNNRIDSVLWCVDRIEDFCNRTPFSADLALVKASILNIHGIILQTVNKRDSALIYFREAYENMSRTPYRREMSNICVNAANVCDQLGNFPEAANWYHRALKVADSLKMESMKHCIYSGLGRVYECMGNSSQSERYFSVVDSLYPPQTDYEAYAYYTNRNNSYVGQEKYVEGLAYAWKAYRSAEVLRAPLVMGVCEANLGESYLGLGRVDSARYFVNRARVSLTSSPEKDDALIFYLNGLYASLALEEGNLKLADHYLSLPFDFRKINPAYLFSHHKRLMQYYSKKGDYAKAFHYQEIVRRYDDSLRNVRYQNSVAEIDYRYRRDTTLLKRDLVIADTRHKVDRLQSAVSAGIVLLVLLLVVAWLLYRNARRRHERQRQQQLALITRLRMENVRNRFSPHFVFNVLNAALPAFWQYEDESLPLRQLVQALRGNLTMADRIAIPLEDELNLVKSYVILRQVTYPLLPEVKWEIAPDVDRSRLIPSMIISVPVENALKHAFPPEMAEDGEGRRVVVRMANENGSCLQITVEDNGVGYERTASSLPADHSTGSGLRILYRTLQLLNERNERKITMEIHDRSVVSEGKVQGTVVLIVIPHAYNYEI